MGDIKQACHREKLQYASPTAAVVSDCCNQTNPAVAKTENPAPLTQNQPPNTILIK